jgi:leucyl aminopeptidase (aminopeptidase T)
MPAVIDMLRVNMDLKPGETLLVLTDVPRATDWQSKDPTLLEQMLERTLLARLVADIAAERFTDTVVRFLPFPATGGHGREPDEAVAAEMSSAQAVIALTSYSLSHTHARDMANQAGARVASLPGFETRMLEAGGPMSADYHQVSAASHRFAHRLTAASQATLRTSYGTELHFSIADRTGRVDDGLLGQPGAFGNLPAGEAYVAPVEGTGRGRLVVPPEWRQGLAEAMALSFEGGVVVSVVGGGEVGDALRELLHPGNDDPLYRARRNLAELGIGANPHARRPDNGLEAEKIGGTVHIGVGDNLHIGGTVEADSHLDFVQPEPDLFLDGEQVIACGVWRIE